MLAFDRAVEGERLRVLVNFAPRPVEVPVPADARLVISSRADAPARTGAQRMLGAYEGVVIAVG
ncbi:MAG: DUF3459 domain-containing protein [Anaeromyxobacter sp.]